MQACEKLLSTSHDWYVFRSFARNNQSTDGLLIQIALTEWTKDPLYPSYLFLGELCVPVKDAEGNDIDNHRKLAEAWPEVVLQASNKDFSSKHWEPLTSCGESIISYKHSANGNRVVVETISWPQPDGNGKKGFFLHAGDHKSYERFLQVMCKVAGKEKAKQRKKRKGGKE